MRDKHIILTMGRSGSNTLVDMLNQNPAILNFGEVLGEWTPLRRLQRQVRAFRNDDQGYLDAILNNTALQNAANAARTVKKILSWRAGEIKKMRNVKTVGFKEFSLNFQRYGLSHYLSEAYDVKVVGLTRANALERMISNALLQETGIVASTSKNSHIAPNSIYINPHTVLKNLEIIAKENEDLLRAIEGLPEERVFRLDYADLYSGDAHTIRIVRKAYSFLGVPEVEPKVRMRKIAKKNPLDAIQNGAEIREVIAASRFAIYLP